MKTSTMRLSKMSKPEGMHDYLAGFEKFNSTIPFYVEKPFTDKQVEDLKKIINTHAFQKYWFVHKDLCDICKHCEFRHMCVDNRIPFERTKKEWYHKIECNYNPFIAKWEGESGYKTLEQCGVISNENIFFIDNDKIKQINLELWGE